MSRQQTTQIGNPSPQAVQAILQAMDFLQKGDRKMAAGILEASYRASSSGLLMVAMFHDPMHYATWALKLDLADLMRHEGWRALIKECRLSPPRLDTPPELTHRFELLQRSGGAVHPASRSGGLSRLSTLGRRRG